MKIYAKSNKDDIIEQLYQQYEPLVFQGYSLDYIEGEIEAKYGEDIAWYVVELLQCVADDLWDNI